MSIGGSGEPARALHNAGRLTGALFVAALLAACGGSSAPRNGHLTSSDPASSAGMSGMNMGSSSSAATQVPAVNGIKPVVSQALATADWQGMKIQARTTTPTEFVLYTGAGQERVVKPTKHTSFHLMVMLTDAHTGVAIPYATVWATITEHGRVVYDEAQRPMLSAYMGPHYGDNVTLPGSGHYQLTLLISPPVAARHLEYRNVWLKPHRVTVGFHWNPPR